MKPGGLMAGPLAPPVPGLPLSPADFNFGIPPAKRPPSPIGDAPIPPPPPPPLLLPPIPPPLLLGLGLFVTAGALRSLVTAFFSLAPLCIWLSKAPLSWGLPEDLGGGPEALGAGGGGGPGGGGGGGGIFFFVYFTPPVIDFFFYLNSQSL